MLQSQYLTRAALEGNYVCSIKEQSHLKARVAKSCRANDGRGMRKMSSALPTTEQKRKWFLCPGSTRNLKKQYWTNNILAIIHQSSTIIKNPLTSLRIETPNQPPLYFQAARSVCLGYNSAGLTKRGLMPSNESSGNSLARLSSWSTDYQSLAAIANVIVRNWRIGGETGSLSSYIVKVFLRFDIHMQRQEFRSNSSFDDQPFINPDVTHVSCSRDIELVNTHEFNAAISLAAFHTSPSTSPGREAVKSRQQRASEILYPLRWVTFPDHRPNDGYRTSSPSPRRMEETVNPAKILFIKLRERLVADKK